MGLLEDLGLPPELVALALNVLNYSMFVGGILVKLPQIINILRTMTVKGFSEVSLATEFLACLSYCAYNLKMGFPFKTWGEMALIAVQVGIQMSLYWSLTTEKISVAPRAACILLTTLAVYALMQDLLPPEFLPILGMVPSVLGSVARVPQIILNFRQGHTGNQSVITWGMSAAGNVIRVITTLAALGDMVLLAGHLCAGLLNLTLVSQILFYWKHTQEVVWSKKDDDSKKAK